MDRETFKSLERIWRKGIKRIEQEPSNMALRGIVMSIAKLLDKLEKQVDVK